MAGQLVEFLGRSAWFACGACPPELQGRSVTLKSPDGGAFVVRAEEVALSNSVLRLAASSAFVSVPFRKVVLSKVVDYLRYHAEFPPSEIRTPLVNDNLVDSGASRWDAHFVNNVEKEMIFELMVASSVMDIPSLLFLTAAKASLLVHGKVPQRLLQEFHISNDLPASENDLLTKSFAAAHVKQGVDGSELGGMALVLNGVCQAADKAGVLSPHSGDMPGPAAATLESFRLASWRAMVLTDWKQLASAPPEVSSDRALLSAAVDASRGLALEFAGPELKKDKKLVLQAVLLTPKTLAYADDSLRADRAFVAEALALRGEALQGAAEAMRHDKELLLGACDKGNGSALMFAIDDLREDRSFMTQCAVKDGQAVKCAATLLLSDQAFMLKVASLNGAALQHMPHKFKANIDVVRAAIMYYPEALVYAHTSVRAEMGAELPQDSAPILAAIKKQQDEAEEEEEEGEFAPPKRATHPIQMLAAAPKAPAFAYKLPKEAQRHKLTKSIHFSAWSTWRGNLGQGNYIAANSMLDKLPCYERPEVDATTLMWGPVGSVGMRLEAFGSADMLYANPEALMTPDDVRQILRAVMKHVAPTCGEYPSNVWTPGFDALGVAFFDDLVRSSLLKQTASVAKTMPWTAAGPVAAEDSLPGSVGSRPQAGKTERSLRLSVDSAPLSGWPVLNGQKESSKEEEGEPARRQQDFAGTAAAMRPPLLPAVGLELEQGGKVLFQGVNAKTGVTGTLLQRFSNGRWKVSMDDGTGNAILKAEYLVALAPAAA